MRSSRIRAGLPPLLLGALFVALDCILTCSTGAGQALAACELHSRGGVVQRVVQIEFDQVEAGVLRGGEGTESVLGFDAHHSAVTDGEEVQDATRFRRRRLGSRVVPTGTPTRQGRSLVA